MDAPRAWAGGANELTRKEGGGIVPLLWKKDRTLRR